MVISTLAPGEVVSPLSEGLGGVSSWLPGAGDSFLPPSVWVSSDPFHRIHSKSFVVCSFYYPLFTGQETAA